MNDDYICYSREEGCLDKIAIVDLKECVNDINECINSGYKIFYDQCYKDKCPNNSYYDENENIYKCNWFHYIDSLTNDIKSSSDNEICPEGYPYERVSTNECLNNCSYTELLNDSVKINNIKSSSKKIKENIKNIFYDEDYNNKDTIIKGKNVIYEMYPTQNETQHEDISSLNIRECIEKLLENPKYEYLFIFKTDYKEASLTRVEYEILGPDNKAGLDLSACEGLKAIYDIPTDFEYYNGQNLTEIILELANQNYDLFDNNDKCYHDICTPFKSSDYSDMILADRRNLYYEITKAGSSNDCKYINFDKNSKRFRCECQFVSDKRDTVEVIKFDKDEMDSFFSTNTYAKFAVL